MTQLADQVFDAVKGWVARSVEPLLSRIKALEELPVPKDGEPGATGDPGADGKDGAAGIDGKDGAAGRDGSDGKDGAAGIDGKDGGAGIDGKDGAAGRDGVDGAAGKDGTKGIDGEPGINGKDGAAGDPGSKGEPGQDGRDGLEGPAGKDALDIEVMTSIDPARKYQRSTFASHKGGLFRSFRATDPLEGDESKAGWECVVNGIESIDVAAGDDMRTMSIVIRCSNGAVVEKQMKVPVIIHRGIWKEESAYSQGDATTRDGSTWILMADQQNGKPGDEGSGWTLSTKRGRDGRDGLRGEKGDRGAEGRGGGRPQSMTGPG